MRLSQAKFINLIKKQRFGFVRLTDYEGNQVAILPTDREETPEKVIKELKEFASVMPGVYTAQCRRARNRDKHNTCYHSIRLGRTPSLEGTGAESREEIREQVIAEMEREQKLKAKDVEIQEIADENKRLKDPLGRIAATLEIVCQALLAKYMPNVNAGGNLQGTETQTINVEEMEQSEILGEALVIFKQHGVDEVFLLKLAQKVDEKPELVSTVKTLLGI